MAGSKYGLFYYYINTQQVCKITTTKWFYIYRLYYHIKSFDSKCFYCVFYYHLKCLLYLCFPPEIISFSPTETQPLLVMLFHAKHTEKIAYGCDQRKVNLRATIWRQRYILLETYGRLNKKISGFTTVNIKAIFYMSKLKLSKRCTTRFKIVRANGTNIY